MTLAARRALERIACASDVQGMRVLPFDQPQAFVVGLARPILFVTRGLLSDGHREHLEPVLAHEHAHIRRHDPLRRVLASLALALHLPGIASWIERRLARAHEMAADAEAAATVCSRERVARALVRLARAQRHSPEMALAFDGSDVEARVACLLDSRPRRDQPPTWALVATALVALALVGTGADLVHHGVESLLGLLGA